MRSAKQNLQSHTWNGDYILDEITDSKDVKDTFAIEDASFDTWKTALSQFDVDGAPRSENTTEKKPATNATDDATRNSNGENTTNDVTSNTGVG